MLPQLRLDVVEKAIAASGVGLDHTIREAVIAIGDYSMNKDLTIFFMLTDRRVAGRRGSIFFHAPIAEITQVVDRTNFVTANLKIHTTRAIADATVGNLTKPLGNYLTALCQLPPSLRTPPPSPLPEPTAEELVSGEWVTAQHAQLSTACQPMLKIVTRKFRDGEITIESAKNLLARVFLQSRNELFGRGMWEGRWLSALPIGDLLMVCGWLLGQPVASYPQENLVTSDYSIGGGSNVGKAVASSAVGFAAAGLLGVGWVSLPGKSVRAIRILLSGAPGMTYVGIEGMSTSNFEPLSAVQPMLLGKFFQALAKYEHLVLSRRALFGWAEDAEQLMNKTDAELEARLGNYVPG